MMKKWLIVYEYSPDEYYAEVSLLLEKRWKNDLTIIKHRNYVRNVASGRYTLAGANTTPALLVGCVPRRSRLTHACMLTAGRLAIRADKSLCPPQVKRKPFYRLFLMKSRCLSLIPFLSRSVSARRSGSLSIVTLLCFSFLRANDDD